MMPYFMKEPCEHCPFRRDVKPFLTPERGRELAYHTQNRYNDFPCHKTTVEHPTDSSEMIETARSKTCAGFLTVQIAEGADCPEDFTPSDKAFTDAWEMCGVYDEKEIEDQKRREHAKNKI